MKRASIEGKSITGFLVRVIYLVMMFSVVFGFSMVIAYLRKVGNGPVLM